MSRASVSETLVLGASPRVFLLPPQVEEDHRAKAVRRRMFLGLGLAVVAVLLGVGGATAGLIGTSAELLVSQSQTADLLSQQQKYSSVTVVQNQVDGVKSIQPLAAAGEILWQPFIASVQGTLPSGTTITGFTASLETVASAATTPVPLQGAHIATLTLTANSPQAEISPWLDNLATVKGFVDATPGTVTLDTETGHYTVTVIMHISTEALADRFTKGK